MIFLILSLIIIFNGLSHYFLIRLFKIHDKDSWLNKKWVCGVLFVPPLALLIAIFLIGAGIIIQINTKNK